MYEQITIVPLDYIILPVVVGVVYFFAFRIRNKFYPKNHPWHNYFIPGLSVKVFGAVFIGLVYAYYYKWGDTYNFFYHSQVINSAFDESQLKWLNLILRIPKNTDGEYYQYISNLEWYNDPSSYTVSAITALLSSLTFNTYLPTTVLFAAISFTGVWAMFRAFASQYPGLIRQLAIATLFIPSVFVWGSGIFKDTICLFALGWLVFSTFRVLIKRDFSIGNMCILFLTISLISIIKLYILLAFLPTMALWIFLNYIEKIKNTSIKFTLRIIFLLSIALSTAAVLQTYSSSLGKYSINEIASTSAITRNYIFYISGDEGSAYSLGDIDPTPVGMLSKFPQAVNVTLFRPYPWEAKKIIVLLSSIEALLFLYLTLKLIFMKGIKTLITSVKDDSTIQFCLLFSIIFSFAVGISSYNFGTLSRYKIPGLPFYLITIILLWYKNDYKKRKFLKIISL